jgi:hypothetical protein
LTAEDIAEMAKETETLEYEMINGGGGSNASLLKTISEAEQLLTATSDYPVGAVVQLQDAIIIAKAIAGNAGSQVSYDNSEKELKNAMSVFKAAKGIVFDVSGITDVYDTERGFRHPGGLHTQADFERIKRMLAEGNPTVTQAYNVLKTAEYAQTGIATYPVETIIRGGGSGDAKALFNQIRTYAKAPTLNNTPTLDDIYDERGREFLDENWRRNDMIRFGHYEDEFFPHYKKYDFASFDKKRRIWPLNNNVLDLNPTWSQNPGY